MQYSEIARLLKQTNSDFLLDSIIKKRCTYEVTGTRFAQKANGFIEKNTNGLIRDVVDASTISPESAMILINTLYFKADWKHKFKASGTHKDTFTTSKGKVTRDIMDQTNKFPYFENDSLQLLEMPHDGPFSMGFILPKQNIANPEFVEELVQNKRTKAKVHVRIPKFTQRKRTDLIPILQQLGINDLFTHQARLNDINNEIYVSKMIHEAVVIMDEKGTEAAAVTVSEVRKCCLSFEKPEQAIEFCANHPFVYYIKRQPDNAIIFVGTYDG